MDALDFRVYGVFTANQAGNLVLLWERMQDNPGEATLSLFSLAGCAIGVMIVIVLRFRFAFFVTPSGSRTLLYMAAVFLAVTAFTGVSLTEPIKGVETGKFPIGSSSWWAGAVSVGSSAMALAVLGTIFVMVGRYKANVISSSLRFTKPVFKTRSLISLFKMGFFTTSKTKIKLFRKPLGSSKKEVGFGTTPMALEA